MSYFTNYPTVNYKFGNEQSSTKVQDIGAYVDLIDRVKDDLTVWEQEPLRGLAEDGELMAFRHNGYWQPMDTLREKQKLEELWSSNKAPWKVW